MKRKILTLAAISLVVLLLCGALLWWFLPLRVLQDVASDEVLRITVFDGGTGKRFAVEDPTAIAQILTNLQAPAYQREAYVGDRDGFSFSLTLYNAQGEILERLAVNGERTLVRGDWAYTPKDATLCFAYLTELESTLAE